MKTKTFTLFVFMFISLFIFSQNKNNYVELQPIEFSESDIMLMNGYPELKMPESLKNRSIPYKVNNSETPYFRTPFTQEGLSCGQASSTGMCFTYEMCAARDLPANINENLYPTHFVYNWDSENYGASGASYYHTLEVLKRVGTPNQEEYGGTPYFWGNSKWLSGYDLYYSAMHNRVDRVYKINIGTAEGMQVLKNWMYDRFEGSRPGGCAITYSANRYPDAILPFGTEEAGKKVITRGMVSSSHSFTFLGFNDSIRYDYNGDGRYTNDIDINGDGIVDMRDWEIGGLIMCETYMGSTAWADNGFCYVTYKAIADGYIYENTVHVMEVNPTYTPLLTAKVTITYDKRKRLKVFAGISSDPNSTEPEHIIDFPIFNYQGGDQPMQGSSQAGDETIEFGLDLTPLINMVGENTNAKYFLLVTENDPSSIGNGTIDSFSIINYTGEQPVEHTCAQTNVSIENNSTTILSISANHTYENISISTDFLPSGSVFSQYTTQLQAINGTEPYRWSFDTDYTVTQSLANFPAGGIAITSGSEVNLGFTFNFFGEEIDKIYPFANGIIAMENNVYTTFPWSKTCKELLTFMYNKAIIPFYVQNHTATSLKKVSGDNFITLIWTSSLIDYSVTIHQDGRIIFTYNNSNLTYATSYVAGLSKGDGDNFYSLKFIDNSNIINGLTYNFISNTIPEEFELSESGLLTGIPSREYFSEYFHFKVRDNNGLVDKIALPFMTDGIILDFTVHTPDDDVIEYGENVTLDLILTNPLNSTVSNISVVASCSDQYITITDNTATCQQLLQSQTTTINNAFAFEVSSYIPNNYTFGINFTVTSYNGTWIYFKTFTAYTPVFSPGTPIVDDGNDNMLVSGETAEITLPILNTGLADAKNLTISARSENNYVNISGGQQNSINIAPQSEFNFNFNLSVLQNIESTFNTVIYVDITDASGAIQQSLEYELTIYTEEIIIVEIFNLHDISPGDERNLILQLKNNGIINANNLNVNIESSDPFISINSESYFIRSLMTNNFAFANFDIQISQDCPDYYIIAIDAVVTSENGLRLVLPFYIQIGKIIEDFETGDFSDLTEWQHSGVANWYVVSTESYEGNYSLRSGIITHNQSSIIETNINVTIEGELSFAYKVSSEARFDFLKFYINNVEVLSESGEIQWTVFSQTLSPGNYNLKWEYKKDMSVNTGADAAWIDNIKLPNIVPEYALLRCNKLSISKTMRQSETEEESIILSNIGNRALNYQIRIREVESGKKNIEGTNITSNFQTFYPGETYDISFTLDVVTPDSDWIRYVEIVFPEDICVNSSTNISGNYGTLNSSNSTGNGATLLWYGTSSIGMLRNGERVNFTVNVTFAPDYMDPASSIEYSIIGDMTGATPHEITQTIVFYNEREFWLNINEISGNIESGEETEILLNFNSNNLNIGTYYAEVIISGALNTLTVPVELIVDNGVNIPVIKTSSDIYCFPNPFTNSISININSGNEKLISVKIYDITGKEISVLDNNPKNVTNQEIFTYKINESLPAGTYLLKIETADNISFTKIVKE